MLVGLMDAIWPFLGMASGAARAIEPIYLLFSAVGIVRSAKRYSGNKAFQKAGYVVPIGYTLYYYLSFVLAIIAMGLSG